jgi:hypothetical protein
MYERELGKLSRECDGVAEFGLESGGGSGVAGLGLGGCFSCHAGVSLM